MWKAVALPIGWPPMSAPPFSRATTLTATPPGASVLAIRDFCSRGIGGTIGTAGAAAADLTPGRAAPGASDRTAALIARTWSGVVPQQPPTSRTPALMKRRAYDAM